MELGCFMRTRGENETGYAFVLALIFVSLLTTVCTVMLSVQYHQMRFVRKHIHQLQAFYTAEAGVYKAMWLLGGHEGRNPMWRTENESIQLLNGSFAHITVDAWGAYLKIQSIGFDHKESQEIACIVGEKPKSPFDQAVEITNLEYPLVVAGQTKIIGDVTVGKKGVETGWVNGKGFSGHQPVDGNIIKKIKLETPFTNFQLFDHQMAYFQGLLESNQHEAVQLNDSLASIEQNLSVNADTTIQVQKGDSLNLSLHQLIVKGNLEIRGEGELRIDEVIVKDTLVLSERVNLQSVLLYGGSQIVVKDQVALSGQLFSGQEIYLQNQAVADNGSVLYVQGESTEKGVIGTIDIQDEAVVIGTLVLPSKEENSEQDHDMRSVHVGTNAIVTGVIFNDHQTYLEGTVLGSLVTGSFYLYAPPTTYVNWLYDATIDRTQLPQAFAMPLLFHEKPELRVLYWVKSNSNKEYIGNTIGG